MGCIWPRVSRNISPHEDLPRCPCQWPVGYETDQERQAREVLKKAGEIGSLRGLDQPEAIPDKAETEEVAADLRARVF